MKYEDVKKIVNEYIPDAHIESAQEGVDVEDAQYFFICIPNLKPIELFEGDLFGKFEDMGYDVSWCPEPETHGNYDAVLNLL